MIECFNYFKFAQIRVLYDRMVAISHTKLIIINLKQLERSIKTTMQNYTTDAINLRSYNFNEADKIMVMYSKEKGLIRCVAKGTRKPTSKLGGRMDLLVANKLLVGKGQNLDTIYQAESFDTFKGLRKNITKLSYAMYCADILGALGIENDSNCSKIYDIFYTALRNMSSAKNTNATLWNVIKFQLRILNLSGYSIELDNCVRCNQQIDGKNLSFCVSSGGAICEKCSPKTSIQEINARVRNTLKKASEVGLMESLYVQDKEILERSFNLLRDYISVRTHKKLKSADLLASLV
ncbi:MAG: DNA repair protein RecO [Candidatus Gastranaerophilales bacterium]|nr:DNA repair protein RecO [Candidatus Gastranaerophilales bacterium]